MPIHDWQRVNAGTFHDFHNAWITELRNELNSGLLPDGFYASGEQRAGDIGPDLLTLQADGAERSEEPEFHSEGDGGLALATHPPRVAFIDEADADAEFYGSVNARS